MSANCGSHLDAERTGAATRHPTPMVAIGVPVYNGAKRLPQTLDSLLAQTFSNFEILISDNGSTDDTPAICAGYAARDPRVRYVRQPTNLGLPNNWNFVAREARCKYFKWASSNDLLAPNMLADCVETLETDASAVLAFGHTALVGADGERYGQYEGDFAILEDAPSVRFRRGQEIAMNNAINGVVRHSALLRTGLIRPYPASDYVLMAELALQGKFVLLPDTLFFRRTDAGSMTTGLRRMERLRLHDPDATGRETIEWRRYRDLLAVALKAEGISLKERLKAASIACRFFLWARRQILSDLAESLRATNESR